MILLNDKPVTPTMFPDGTSQVWKLDLAPPFRVVWRFEHEAELIHLMQLLDLLTRRSSMTLREVLQADEVEVYVPYLPYGRQDKHVENDSTFALRTFARIAKTATRAGWAFLDPHSYACRDYGLDCVGYPPELYDLMRGQYDFVIFPDKGAESRYVGQINGPFWSVPFVVGDKVRDQTTGHITHYSLPAFPVEPTRILVVDDLCDGGATFDLLGRAIKQRTEAPVDLFVTHGIFSRGLAGLLGSYARILTTDSFRAELRDSSRLRTAAAQNPRFREFETAIEAGRLIVFDALEMMGYSTANEGTANVG